MHWIRIIAAAFAAACMLGAASSASGVRDADWHAALDARRAALREGIAANASRDELLVALDIAPVYTARRHRQPQAAIDAERRAELELQGRIVARLRDLHADAAVVQHVAAAFCDTDGVPCAGDGAIHAYAGADPDNAWPWLLSAALAKRRGHDAEAWRAIERAANASRADSYERERLRAFHAFVDGTRLPDGTQPAAHARIEATLGYWMAAWIPGLARAQAVCTTAPDAAPLTPAQRGLCFRAARVLAGSSSSLDAGMGTRMMRKHAATSDETREAERRHAEFEALHRSALLLPDYAGEPSRVDVAELEAYFEDMMELGEMGARRRLVERAGYTLDAWIAARATTASDIR